MIGLIDRIDASFNHIFSGTYELFLQKRINKYNMLR